MGQLKLVLETTVRPLVLIMAESIGPEVLGFIARGCRMTSYDINKCSERTDWAAISHINIFQMKVRAISKVIISWRMSVRLRALFVLSSSWGHSQAGRVLDTVVIHLWSIKPRSRACSSGALACWLPSREVLMMSYQERLENILITCGWTYKTGENIGTLPLMKADWLVKIDGNLFLRVYRPRHR